MRICYEFGRRAIAMLGGALLFAVSLPGVAADLVRFQNGEVISSSDLSSYLDRRADLKATARNKWTLEKIVREMALTRTLVLEGLALGQPRSSERESERFDDAYALGVFKKLSATCVPPADNAESRKFYDENPKVFQVPPMARISRVMIPAAEVINGEDANAWLMLQARAIAGGSKSFDAVVQQADGIYRLDPQGDLGWVVLAEENAILRTLAASRQGDMVGPVRDGDFVYLFSVLEKRESRALAWEEVAMSVPARALRHCRQANAQKVESDLFSKYGVVVDGAAVNALFNNKVTAER